MILFASTNLIDKYEVLGNVFFFFSQNKNFLSPFVGSGRDRRQMVGNTQTETGLVRAQRKQTIC